MSDYQKPYQGNQHGGYQNNPPHSQQYSSNSQYGNRNNGGYQNRYPNRSNEPIDESKVKLYKSYVGTGNRDTPEVVLKQMHQLAAELSQFGYVLRSGGLDGPDLAFEAGSKETELHLPWRDFNQRKAFSYFNGPENKVLAKMFQPTFDGLKPAIQAFLCKNVRCIMGKDLKSPARFIVIWSTDGAEHSRDIVQATGAMAHLIKIASAMKIPVFNLGKQGAEQRLKQYLDLSQEQPIGNPHERDHREPQYNTNGSNYSNNNYAPSQGDDEAFPDGF